MKVIKQYILEESEKELIRELLKHYPGPGCRGCSKQGQNKCEPGLCERRCKYDALRSSFGDAEMIEVFNQYDHLASRFLDARDAKLKYRIEKDQYDEEYRKMQDIVKDDPELSKLLEESFSLVDLESL